MWRLTTLVLASRWPLRPNKYTYNAAWQAYTLDLWRQTALGIPSALELQADA
jgi:hypothetical protein